MTRKSISKIAVNGARLIATVSAIALAGSALAAGEATREFYRSLVPSQQTQQLPEECYDKFGKLVITPQNVELCSALPTAAIAVPGVPLRDNDNDGGTDVSTRDGGGGGGGGPPDSGRHDHGKGDGTAGNGRGCDKGGGNHANH
jgi:hypothetical protein